MAKTKNIPFTIRSFTAGDLAACKRLYTEGLLSKSIAPNDTGVDIDNIQQVYMRKGANHFWVAVANDVVVGMLGVQHHEPGVGEIRRLRVVPQLRRKGIGSALLETALAFCQQKSDVKVTLDTVMDRDIAIQLFEKFHFKHHKSKTVGDKELLYFYLDLYSSEKSQKSAGKETQKGLTQDGPR